MSPASFDQPASSPVRRRSRVVGFAAAAAITGALALGFLVTGATLLIVDLEKDGDGYYTTSSERLRTDAYAISSGSLGVDLGAADDLITEAGIGHVRLHAESNNDEPIFVGIARSDDLARYLRDTAHTTVTDVDADLFVSSFDPTYRDSDGDRRPAPPAERDIWVVSATGTGEQSLEWKIRDGDWSLIVMNADGSRRVDASVSAGAELPFAGPAGWSALGIGAFTALTAAALLLLGFRGPRRNQPTPAAITAAQPAS